MSFQSINPVTLYFDFEILPDTPFSLASLWLQPRKHKNELSSCCLKTDTQFYGNISLRHHFQHQCPFKLNVSYLHLIIDLLTGLFYPQNTLDFLPDFLISLWEITNISVNTSKCMRKFELNCHMIFTLELRCNTQSDLHSNIKIFVLNAPFPHFSTRIF